MYCANCGVKLADTENVCPLCGTKAFHPDIVREEKKSMYPKNKYPIGESGTLGLAILATVMFVIPFAMVLISDLLLHHGITWSGYVVGGLILGYLAFVLPLWFRKKYPVIFVPCWFVAAGLYLLYVNCITDGGWYLSFAFPILCGSGAVVITVVILLTYLRRGRLYIFGGAILATGVLMSLIEFLMYKTFINVPFIGWSFYPLASFTLIGGLLIFLGICRPAREAMERTFFV